MTDGTDAAGASGTSSASGATGSAGATDAAHQPTDAPTETTGRAAGGGLLGVGFRSLLEREILRFVRRPRNTFVPPAITNVLYFAVFGVILGSRIDDIAGVPYLLFILPGLVVLGAISNAFENASFSIFHGRWNEYIQFVR